MFSENFSFWGVKVWIRFRQTKMHVNNEFIVHLNNKFGVPQRTVWETLPPYLRYWT